MTEREAAWATTRPDCACGAQLRHMRDGAIWSDTCESIRRPWAGVVSRMETPWLGPEAPGNVQSVRNGVRAQSAKEQSASMQR